MARKRLTVPTVPTGFVGTFYDTAAGVYLATRKDGSVTVGQIGRRGVNVKGAAVLTDARTLAATEQ